MAIPSWACDKADGLGPIEKVLKYSINTFEQASKAFWGIHQSMSLVHLSSHEKTSNDLSNYSVVISIDKIIAGTTVPEKIILESGLRTSGIKCNRKSEFPEWRVLQKTPYGYADVSYNAHQEYVFIDDYLRFNPFYRFKYILWKIFGI